MLMLQVAMGVALGLVLVAIPRVGGETDAAT